MTTNYTNCFIAVSPDSSATSGDEPKQGTIADEQLRLLREAPYERTSDELMFEVYAARSGIPDEERANAWTAFQAKPTACLRASALVKSYGWGIHHDADAKVAAFAVGSDDYLRLAADPALKQTKGMRSKRNRSI